MINRLRSVLRVIAGSFTMQAKERATNQFFVGTLLVLPIIFTLLSVGTYLYGGKGNFGLYAVIGAGMMGVWNANLWTSGRIVEGERRGGTLSMLIASPTPFPIILVGKSLSNAFASLISLDVKSKPLRSLYAGKRAIFVWYAMDRTSRSAISALRSCDSIGMAASNAGAPWAPKSSTAFATP